MLELSTGVVDCFAFYIQGVGVFLFFELTIQYVFLQRGFIMSKGSVNKVILVGNLGQDPEVRYTPSGSAVTTISLATTEAWNDKDGNKQERTEWHRVVFFRRLAEIAGEYLKKGSQVYIEGQLRTNKWQDKSGNDRYTTEIIANEMQMLGSKSSISAPSKKGTGAMGGNYGNTPSAPPNSANNQQESDGFGPEDFDFEIPF